MESENKLTFSNFFYSISTISIFVFTTIASVAQNNNPQWVNKVYFGKTNVFEDLTCDDRGNTYTLGEVNETINKWDDGLAIVKYDFEGNLVWQKSFEGIISSKADFRIEAYKNHIYLVTLFKGSLKLDANNTIVSQNNYDDILVMKLDEDGDYIWAKTLGITGNDEMLDVWFNNGNILLKVESGTYNYDGTQVGIVDRYKYGVARINEDGSFHSFHTGASNHYDVLYADVIDNVNTEIWWRSAGPAPQFNKIVLRGTADTNQNFTNDHTIPYGTRNLQTNFAFGKCKKLPSGNGYMMAISSYDYDWGDDSIMRSKSGVNHQILRLNNDLTLDSYMEVANYRDFTLNEDYLAVQASAQPSLIIGNDSIYTSYISSGGHPLTSCVTYITDHDFTPVRHFQVSSADGSMDNEGIDIDTAGYVVTQYTESKDILWGDTTIEAALRSWKHLTAIGRESSGGTVGDTATTNLESRVSVNANLLNIYPNPGNGVLHVLGNDELQKLSAVLYSLSGEVVLQETITNNEIDVHDIVAGTYLLQLQLKDEIPSITKIVLY